MVTRRYYPTNGCLNYLKGLPIEKPLRITNLNSLPRFDYTNLKIKNDNNTLGEYVTPLLLEGGEKWRKKPLAMS